MPDESEQSADAAAHAGAESFPATPAGVDLPALVADFDARLIGGPPVYTRSEVAARADIEPDSVRRIWQALGLAAVPEDVVAFTDADVEALRRLHELQDTVDEDDEDILAMSRIAGQTFARLASWQGQMALDVVARDPDLLGSPKRIAELVGRLMPLTEELHTYVWRRQMAAFWSRTAALVMEAERNGHDQSDADGTANGWPAGRRPESVGFVDMTAFTTFTRRADEAQLRDTLERFESLAAEVVTRHRGQIIKTIGDEILYVAATPAAAADIALDLVAAAEAEQDLPPLRAGVATGPVVNRLGDVYGATVNIASRLTSLARSGTVLVDRQLAGELADDARFSLRPLRPESVRGYHHLRASRVRHSDPAPPAVPVGDGAETPSDRSPGTVEGGESTGRSRRRSVARPPSRRRR